MTDLTGKLTFDAVNTFTLIQNLYLQKKDDVTILTY